MKILGISAFYHDAAAAIIVDDQIISAVQEERFTRKKHDAEFPVNAIKYCLEETGLSINELDAIIFYDKPLLKFERLLQTYYAFAPKGILSFLKAIPVWINEKLFLKKLIYDGLKEVEIYDKKQLNLLFSDHHLSHAASAFFASPFEKSAILTIDGVGEWATASIGIGENNSIKILKELKFPHSLGLLYSAFTYFLGFRVNSGEYKLMGLAPYGDPDAEQTKTYISSIKSQLVDIKSDGSLWMDQSYFNYATGLRMIQEAKWEKLFNLKTRKADSEITQAHCNLAIAIQMVTEEIVLKMAENAKKITGCNKLCLAGGVALNCVANGKLLEKEIFQDIYIQPASGDAGGAIGAAYIANHVFFNKERTIQSPDAMSGTYLGPDYSEKEIVLMNRKVKADTTHFPSFETLSENVAQLLADGNVIGWFQGKMEFGPRSLGNRSILGDPRDVTMQKKINLQIKYRESFRPFAPSVLEEDVLDYFAIKSLSPYMLLVAPVQEKRRHPLPDNFFNIPLKERLGIVRSDIQAITHLDFSARVQTVSKKTNPRYWSLINNFKEKTGYGLVVNTSFNVRGEPIVCTPHDAYRCFMNTDMDYLVINNFLYKKTSQPHFENKEKWRQKFKMD